MAQRKIENKLLHDRVVEEIKDNLNQKDYDIYINPGSEKNASVAGNYPDVIMTKKGETTVQFIMEVETSDSITKTEAEDQWKKYATEIKATFYLIVPEASRSRAIQLCQQVGVNARFATYVVNQFDGRISFNFD